MPVTSTFVGPKIGITGASGMIGSYLLKHWAGTHRVSVYTSKPVDSSAKMYWRASDASDQLNEFCADQDVIVHLAHNLTPIDSQQYFPDGFGQNTRNTQLLIKALLLRWTAGLQAPLLIYLSSGGAVYGNVSATLLGIDESAVPQPSTPYGAEKLACEHLLSIAAVRGLCRLIILRASNVYGAPLNTSRKQGVLGVWLSRVAQNLPVVVTSRTGVVRDYLHLSDFASALDSVVGTVWTAPAYCFNLGTGVGKSIEELLLLTQDVTGRKFEVEFQPHIYPESAPDWNVLNSKSFQRATGWCPQVSIEDGLKMTWHEMSRFTQKGAEGHV